MNDQIQYQGARFYKCALQVNPASYAQNRGETVQNEAEYNQQILEYCSKNKIEVVGLADHGSVETSKILQKYLIENDIVVFPGFEISSSEKIHMVCLYPENTTIANLNGYLGQLMGSNISILTENPMHPSSLSCEKIATTILNEQHGFWYAAHATAQNGLLRLSNAGDNYVDLWKKEELVRAIQIPGSIEDLDVGQENLKKYKDIIENKNPNYKREKNISVINAKDVCKPEHLAKLSASCLVKMTTPTFAAFKKAFYDSDSRIRLNHQIPERPYSFIKSIRWQGAGFFTEQSIGFSENLNAIIGGRGTGKTTLLESIRYVLDLPISEKNTTALENVYKTNFASSQITLDIISKAQQGKRYTISRRFGQMPVVKNDYSKISHLTPKDLLPDIEFLGQNEILEIERDDSAKLTLINNFLPNIQQLNTDLSDIKRKLVSNRGKLLKAEEKSAKLEAQVAQEYKLTEQATQFKELGIDDKLKNTQLLAKEQVIQGQINQQLKLLDNWLTYYQEIFDLTFLQDANIVELPNKKNIIKVREVFVELQKNTDGWTAQINEKLQSGKDQLQEIQKIRQKISENIQDELNEAIALLPEQAGKTGKQLGTEYASIVKRLTLIKQDKNEYRNQQDIITTIKAERQQLLEEYRDTTFIRFNMLHKAVKKLNKGSLRGKVRINVISCGNKHNLQDFLRDISGIGQSKIQWLNEKDIELDLLQWVEWIEKKDPQLFMNKYKQHGLAKGVADKLVELDLNKQLELQEIELKDMITIELNTAHDDAEAHFVLLDELSTGQKCTAILNLLLLNRDDPLIIDQPEDNLDNAFIAERIVQNLRKFKTNRQFLFATHNANIPVFGDAELIAVLDSNKDGGTIKYIGSIDETEVGKQAAEILEGGKAAFNTRKDKYGF